MRLIHTLCLLQPLAHALLWQAIERVVESNCTNEKGCGHERIFAPSAGSHLSHNLVSAQIQAAKQQRRRTDATVLRVDWKETRLTIPA